MKLGMHQEEHRTRLWEDDRIIFGLCVTTALIFLGSMAVHIRHSPQTTPDTSEYIALAAHRPPVYGWLVNAYQGLTGGMGYLPLSQLLLLGAALLFLAIETGRVLRNAVLGALLIPLVLYHTVIHDSPTWAMSEAIFLPAVMVGLAFEFRYVRKGSACSLVGASIFFALAAATRTAGSVLPLLPVLTVVLDRRFSWRAGAWRGGQALLAAAVVLMIAAAGNYAKNGRFEIGGAPGLSLLGKVLLLVQPEDVADLPPPFAATLSAAAEHRRLIAEVPDPSPVLPEIQDPSARMRAQTQSYEDLRYATFFQASEATWPAWAQADMRRRSDLAMEIGKHVIFHHPVGYLRLWVVDFAALVSFPMFWPRWAIDDLADDQQRFSACARDNNCWAMTSYRIPLVSLIFMLVASFGATLGGAVFAVAAARRVLLRRTSPLTAMFWAASLIALFGTLSTAAFEGGIVRYTGTLHIFGVALLLWATTIASRKLADVIVTLRQPV
jgi:hypothetical protein